MSDIFLVSRQLLNSFLQVDRWSTTSLNDFISNQAKRAENVATQLQAVRQSVLDVITEACSRDLNRFLVQNGFRPNPNDVKTRTPAPTISFTVENSNEGEKVCVLNENVQRLSIT